MSAGRVSRARGPARQLGDLDGRVEVVHVVQLARTRHGRLLYAVRTQKCRREREPCEHHDSVRPLRYAVAVALSSRLPAASDRFE